MENFDIWKLIAGLGIFLFGMFLLEEGIKNLSGRAFKKFIRKHTSKKFNSIISGTLVTMVLQSSSVVSLMVLAFVGAGIISLTNAIGVIIGSNLGTTATGWIVATLGFKFNIEAFALPFVGIGGLGLIFLSKSEKLVNISKVIIGFGFIFLGLEYMKLSISDFAETFDISAFSGYGSFVFLLVGFIFTAIIQSSSATMVIVLSALNSGIIDFEAAAALVIGSDLGTTMTVLIGGMGSTVAKRQVAFSHFFFNLATDLIAFVLLGVLIYVVKHIYHIEDDLMGLVAFHSTFNLVGIIIFYPFIGSFAKFLKRVFKEKKDLLSQYIDKVTPQVPEAAIKALHNESMGILRLALFENALAFDGKEGELINEENFTGLQKELVEKKQFLDIYDGIKHLEGEIIEFYILIQQQKLIDKESEELNQIIVAVKYASSSVKSIKDIRHNLIDFSNSVNHFVHEEYKATLKRQHRFYEEYSAVLKRSEATRSSDEIVEMYVLNKELDNEFLQRINRKINNDNTSEIELSNLFNVNREIYLSNKMMINALENLFEVKEK